MTERTDRGSMTERTDRGSMTERNRELAPGEGFFFSFFFSVKKTHRHTCLVTAIVRPVSVNHFCHITDITLVLKNVQRSVSFLKTSPTVTARSPQGTATPG